MREWNKGIKVGDKAVNGKTMTEAETYLGVGLIGALNPVHIDKIYCAKTRFKKPIGVGLLVNTLSVHTAQNCLLMQPSVLVSLDATFTAPVYFGDTIVASVEVTGIDEDQGIISFTNEMKNQDDATVLVGKFSLRVIEEKEA